MELSVEDITFGYTGDVLVLRGVSLKITPGESIALIGENGAGKSTLAMHLNGLLKPNSGHVFVGGWDTKQVSTAKLAARVGYVFQNPNDQLFERTVAREVSFGPRNLGYSEEKIAHKVSESLTRTGLQDVKEIHPYDLPFSQRKLVLVAAVLAMAPPVMILDEPTIGQDLQGITLLTGIIADLKKSGRTVVVISHDQDFCAENCQRVVVMAGGKILADGSTEDILYQHDILNAASVEPPQISRLVAALDRNLGKPLTVDGFVSRIKNGS